MHEPSSFQALPPEAPHLRPAERVIGYALGGLFAVLGGLALATMDGLHWGPVTGGILLLVLGLQALWATRQDRRSWLARIGPLP